MKNTVLFALILFFNFFNAQIAIGKTSVDGSGILDFYSEADNVKGIILPRTTSAEVTESGTLIFDATTKKVQYYHIDKWVNLSDEGIYTETLPSSSTEISKGVIFGASSTNAKGVLVLESTNKALILPKISDPHINVKNPEAGMICYDTKSNTLAVFNGKEWSYWK